MVRGLAASGEPSKAGSSRRTFTRRKRTRTRGEGDRLTDGRGKSSATDPRGAVVLRGDAEERRCLCCRRADRDLDHG